MYGRDLQPPMVLCVCESGSVAEPGRAVVIIALTDSYAHLDVIKPFFPFLSPLLEKECTSPIF